MSQTQQWQHESDDNGGESPIVAMVRCDLCGHMVPEANMELHLARSCEARKRPARSNRSTTANHHHRHLQDRTDDSSSATNDSSPGNSADMMDSEREECSLKLPSQVDGMHVDLTTPPRSRTRAPPRSRTRKRIEWGSSIVEAPPPAAAAARNTDEIVDIADEDDSADEIEEERTSRNATRKGNSNHCNARRDDVAAPLSNNSLIDLMDDDEEDGNANAGGDNDEGTEEHWTCSRCTLINPMASSYCEACLSPNQNRTRQPDPVRRERLIYEPEESMMNHYYDDDHHLPHHDNRHRREANGSAASYLSGGAIMGGLLGAAASYARGRSMTSGALSGAMQGALGGAVFNEVFRESTINEPPRRQQSSSSQSSTRSRRGRRRPYQDEWEIASGANNDSSQRERRRRRSSQSGPHGSLSSQRSRRHVASMNGHPTTTTIISTPQGTRIIVNGNGSGSALMRSGPIDGGIPSSMLLQALLTSPHGQFVGGGSGIDGMSYEQLLSRFGDGSENMGASEGQISSLPESTVDDVASLPPDCRQCSICLEDFKDGDKRKILPCLHGFHHDCVNKWLRQNGTTRR